MIRLRKINKSYRRPGEGALQVLHDVDLDVAEGEFVAIVGRSGSGKTTLMNLIGLLDRPDSGELDLDGRAVAQLPARERARLRNRQIGFVFQQFHLLPCATAVENAALPLLYSRDGASPRRAIEALRQVGLEDRMTHRPSQLSGGQQQRVAIARAIVNEPRVLLADEPTGNLDRESGRAILELFRRLHEAGRTILLITHDEEISRQADRILSIDDGRLTEKGRVVA